MRRNSQHGTPVIVPASSEAGTAKRLENIGFDGKNEQWLQETIHLNPEILPIDELEPAYKPIVPVCMELQTPGGYVDNFYVTPRGNLIFAECKLWRNPEARRRVVAQVFDYIVAISGWTFEELEAAVMKARTGGKTGKAERLFHLVEHMPESPDESCFIDAVSRNLRLGRGLFLIVGDGIREEAEALVNHVDAHPGLHFSLALVEVAGFRLPGGGGDLLQPRTVARTVIVERAIVRIEGGTASVSEPAKPAGAAEEFFECLSKNCEQDLANRLQAFLQKLDALGVDIEVKRTLVPKFRVADDVKIALFQVDRKGRLWTQDTLTKKIIVRELRDVVGKYLEEVARLIGGTAKLVDYTSGIKLHGRAPGIDDLLDHEDEWLSCITRLKDGVGKIIGTNT